MEEDRFLSAVTKVGRATYVMREIDDRMKRFVEKGDASVTIVPGPVAGSQIMQFSYAHALPANINACIGDAVHNLRAALDHVWTASVRILDPGISLKNLYFPIRETAQQVAAALDDGKQDHAIAIATSIGQKIRKAVLDDIKPYGEWGSAIGALGKLDNIDKHRMLITLFVIGGAEIEHLVFGNNNAVLNTSMYSSSGALMRFQGPVHSANIRPNVVVHFAEPDMPSNPNVMAELFRYREAVINAIETFRTCFG